MYTINSSVLVIKDFHYDGSGPDAFFWAGTNESPNDEGSILPYPFEGQFYQYQDIDAPVLGRSEGETILLHIPPDLNIRDIKDKLKKGTWPSKKMSEAS